MFPLVDVTDLLVMQGHLACKMCSSYMFHYKGSLGEQGPSGVTLEEKQKVEDTARTTVMEADGTRQSKTVWDGAHDGVKSSRKFFLVCKMERYRRPDSSEKWPVFMYICRRD